MENPCVGHTQECLNLLYLHKPKSNKMKKIVLLLALVAGFAATAWSQGIAIPEVKITVNPNHSITYTQEIPPGTPAVNSVSFGFVAGQGNWSILATVSGSSMVNNQIVWTSPACLLTDSVQYAGGANVYFADPTLYQATGFSTTFLRIPCLTFQGTGGCCGAPTGTQCPSDGSCPPPATTGNGGGNGNGPSGTNKGKKK